MFSIAALGALMAALCAHGRMLTFCLYRTPFIDMSNSLTQLVPLLDGSNYPRWAELMQAYLQQQEVWIIVDPPAGVAAPTLAQDGSNRNEVLGWAQMLSRACYAVESPSAHLPVELWIEAHVVVDGQERLVVLLLQSSLIYYCTWAMM